VSHVRLILASASPRRAELLRRLGIEPEIIPAHVDEAYLPGESPEAHVERLARLKAETAARSAPGTLVVGGDTVVVLDGRILGKPEDDEAAVSTLLSLAGRTHQVYSGVALAGTHGVLSAVGRAEVRFRDFGRAEAGAYAATGEPRDKAGAYGIQGMGAALVEEIRGDYYSVVGLPVGLLVDLLRRAGWRYAFGFLEPAPPGSDPAP